MAEQENKEHKNCHDHIPEEVRQHAKNARDEMRKSMELLLPEGFLEHRKGARREMLLAWRSLLDAAIQRMDEKA